MTSRGKLLAQILSGRSDANIPFGGLCELLRTMGFLERIHGSHHIFTRDGVPEILNVQPLAGGKAKAYQVKQVRKVIVSNKLAGDENER